MTTQVSTSREDLPLDIRTRITQLQREAEELEGTAREFEIQAWERRHEAEFLLMKEKGLCVRCQWMMRKETIDWHGACGHFVTLEWCCLGECDFRQRGSVEP